MRNTWRGSLFLAVAVLLLVGLNISDAGIVTTRRIAFSHFGTWYDSGDSALAMNNIAASGGTLYTHGDPYTFTLDAQFTFAPQMLNDVSGSKAKAYFDATADLVLTGGLKYNGNYVYGGAPGTANAKQILLARPEPVYEDASAPSDERWLLEEDQFNDGEFNRSFAIDLVAGSEGLASGIEIDVDGDTINDITLKYFETDFDMQFFTSNPPVVTNFSSDMWGVGHSMHFTGIVPEPATLAILALGGLFLRVRRK